MLLLAYPLLWVCRVCWFLVQCWSDTRTYLEKDDDDDDCQHGDNDDDDIAETCTYLEKDNDDDDDDCQHGDNDDDDIAETWKK